MIHKEEPMSVQSGHQMFRATRTASRQRPIDTDALRRSRITRGAAMYRAAHGDRDVRDALATIATEATETPPPTAA